MSSEVPEGWREASFSDLARYDNGRAFKPTDWGNEGLPIVRIAQITNPDAETNRYLGEVEDRHRLNDGDLIFSWSATLAVMKWRRGPAVLNQHLFKVTPAAGIDQDWLQFRLEASIPDLTEEAHGTTMKHIRKGTLSSQTTLVPPLDEQRRIAEVLRSVDGAIDAAAQAAEQEARTFNRMIDLLFGPYASAKGAPDDQTAPLSEFCERVTYGFTNPMPTTENGPWMVTALNVRNGRIDYGTARHTSTSAYDALSSKSRPKVGAVLVTKDGTLGRIAVVDRPDICVNQSVAVLDPQPESLDPQFLSYLLQSAIGQTRMLADSGGGSVKHIYITKLGAMPISVPPLETQRAITGSALQCEIALQMTQTSLRQLRELRVALATTLLSGHVRVPA